jgi:putative membrane protein
MIRAILCAGVLSAAALGAAASLAAPGSPAADQLAKEDRDFFEDAAQSGLLQIKLGQLVVKQGASEDVKHFAQRMIDDHTKVNQKLAEVARQEGLSMPTDLDRKRQDKLDKLAKLGGSKLDQEYLSQVLDEHKDDVKAFEKEAKDGKDAAMKQLAQSSLAALNEHLTMARQIHDRLLKK